MDWDAAIGSTSCFTPASLLPLRSAYPTPCTPNTHPIKDQGPKKQHGKTLCQLVLIMPFRLSRQPSSRSSSTCLQTSFRTSPFRQSRFSSAKWLMAQDIHTTSVGFVDNCGTASGALRRNFPGLRLATRLPARISCIVEEWQPRLVPLIASLLLASSSFRVCRPENKPCRAFVSKWKPGKTDSHVPAFQHG